MRPALPLLLVGGLLSAKPAVSFLAPSAAVRNPLGRRDGCASCGTNRMMKTQCAMGKGFGEAPPPSSKNSKGKKQKQQQQQQQQQQQPQEQQPKTVFPIPPGLTLEEAEEAYQAAVRDGKASARARETTVTPSQGFSSNEGRDIAMKALLELQKEESKPALTPAQRKFQAVGDMDEAREARRAIEENPDAAVIPQKVADRMIKRIIPFFLVPVFGGIGLFIFYFVVAKQYDWTFQPWIVAFSTQAPFAIGLIGITYGIFSTSWDDDREGSFIGFEELKRNWNNLGAGLKRTGNQQLLTELEEQEAKDRAKVQAMNRNDRRAVNKRMDKDPLNLGPGFDKYEK